MKTYYLLFVLVALMIIPLAQAQIEVEQSTEINGHKTSIKTESKAPFLCQGTSEGCDLSHMCVGNQEFCQSSTIVTRYGGVSFRDLPGLVLINYCHNNKCHEYILYDNGTIRGS